MNKIKILLILSMGLFLSVGCKREEFSNVPATSDVLSTIMGTWSLKTVIQKDETAEVKNSPYVSMDITTLFPYTQYKLALTGASGANSGTFTAVPGASPKIIVANTGTWQVDDVKNPKTITFTSGTQKTVMQIGSYPTSFKSSFALKQTKVDVATNKPAITYSYEFVKQ